MKKSFFPFSFLIYSPRLLQQRGASTIEFLLTAIPVILLGLGAMESGRWYIYKHHLRLALLETNRAASVAHADPKVVEQKFEQAISPLFAPAGAFTSIQARTQDFLHKVSQNTGAPPWLIMVDSPTSKNFQDFSRSDLEISLTTGLPAIDNNYQAEQHQEKGQGTHSQQTIFQANTLSLTLTYPYKPLVPGIGTLFSLLHSSAPNNIKAKYYQAGYLPIQITHHISMQSHPVRWPNLPSGKVQWADGLNIVITPNKPTNNPPHDPCAGLWCGSNTAINDRASQNGNTNLLANNHDTNQAGSNHNGVSFDEPISGVQVSTDKAIESASGYATEPIDKELCGITLCCL